MNHQEILDLVNRIETEIPVSSWKFKDVHVWPIIRMKLAFQLYSQNLQPSDKKSENLKRKGLLGSLFDWENRSIYHRIADRKVSKKISKSDLVFFTYDSNRTLFNNRWHNRNIDVLIDKLPAKKFHPVVFEVSQLNKRMRGRANEHYIADLNSYIERNYKINRSELPFVVWEGFELFTKSISDYVIQNKREQFSISNLTIEVLSVLEYARIFEILLIQSDFKLAFVTCFYEKRSMGFILACKRRKIKVVEVPHGTHGNTHVAYAKWMSVPISGYELLPDIFWCWGKDEYDAINFWASKSNIFHQSYVGGNPWVSYWKGNSKDVLFAHEQLIKVKGKSKRDNHILISLQPYPKMEQVIPQLILNLIKQTSGTWYWWIRLHPRQPQSVVEITDYLSISSIGVESINVQEANSFPLPAILKEMDLHITDFSSVVLEALEMNVPSLVYSENGSIIFADAIKKGYVARIDEENKDFSNLFDQLKVVRIEDSNLRIPDLFEVLLERFI